MIVTGLASDPIFAQVNKIMTIGDFICKVLSYHFRGWIFNMLIMSSFIDESKIGVSIRGCCYTKDHSVDTDLPDSRDRLVYAKCN
jgi:hypothetical protein